MSYVINPDLPRGQSQTRIYDFAAPPALNTRVIGSDQETGESFFNVTTLNSILRIVLPSITESQTALEYKIVIARDAVPIHTFHTPQLGRDLQVIPVVFPANLSPGQYQIYLYQTKGDPTAQTAMVTFQVQLV